MHFDLDKIFRRPLIVGASVSADWNSPSPGKRVALRHTTPDLIRTVATSGATSRETWPKVDEIDLIDRTILLGVDLFFWDSTFTPSSLKPSLQILKEVSNVARDRAIPLVLGDIPELLPGRQPSRDTLNDEIAKIEAQNRLCRVIPFDRIHREILATGALSWRGKRYGLDELVPDGLHLSDLAGAYLMEVLETLFRPRVSGTEQARRSSITSPPRA